MNEDSRYEAVCSRDARFDGQFFFAVITTGIYCRPSCPAVTPKRKNVRFFATAAAAQGAGFRACRRCRPDAVPGSAEWNARADVVGRAMRLIGDGVVDREGVAGLAVRLGYSARQVQRQLTAELGAGPVALARAQRAHTARVLLQTTRMQAADIAFAAGFASVRQFNDTIREIYASTPTALRLARPGSAARYGSVAREEAYDDGPGARSPGAGRAAALGRTGTAVLAPRLAPPGAGIEVRADATEVGPVAVATAVDGAPRGIPLRLAYRGVYAGRELFDYLQSRQIAGVEEVTGETGARLYRRTLRLPGGGGIAEVRESAADRGWLECRLQLCELRDLTTASQRMRRLFDLDADPYAVAERLGACPRLGPLVAARPGLRVPGSADPHELALRAVLGQWATRPQARRLGEALVTAYGDVLATASGGLTHLFPRAEALADASLREVGLAPHQGDTLRALATALAGGTVRLDPGADRDEAEHGLLALPGVGRWAAGYIRMRALGDPDVWLADAGTARGAREEGAGEGWRPWRSYATHYLWAAQESSLA
ncbi:DNA-3-methyladenine glycosylase 2 family protein [Streptomyces zagrosensis]|uniref:DNA-3-methyladenine glycosylase II n=1 Tax=Streptomyces zagrosensis TaxID=1042984 RepID=A0A7W9QJE2_9ACTN|nr:AlkA N-terminal domain-containing protein [Streptomyces zagrosensis]MBB5940362.1 AraC family transcriptional regulator of adaptative response / DNA-3-methyladenine glycosylase II [Streptomyces zagrosensis]